MVGDGVGVGASGGRFGTVLEPGIGPEPALEILLESEREQKPELLLELKQVIQGMMFVVGKFATMI